MAMTNEDFRAWRVRLKLTFKEVSEKLGISQRLAYDYAAAKPIPLLVERACRDLSNEQAEARFHNMPRLHKMPPELKDALDAVEMKKYSK